MFVCVCVLDVCVQVSLHCACVCICICDGYKAQISINYGYEMLVKRELIRMC